jgi:hypothetical protein
MAISGNLAASTSVYTVLSGILQSLHAHGETDPPSSNDFVEIAKRVASSIYEGTRVLGENGLFGFLIFGFDIETNEPFVAKISTELSESKRYEILARKGTLDIDGVICIGSGEIEFTKLAKEENKNDQEKLPLSELFYKFVRSGAVKSVGGLPQLLQVTSSDAVIEPVLIGSDDGSVAKIYHSGFEVDGYKSVGEYMVGLTLRGFNMGAAERVQALKDSGINTESELATVGEENQASIQFRLNVLSRHRTPLNLSGVATIAPPRRPRTKSNIGYKCPECNKVNFFFSLDHNVGPEIFSKDLSFCFECKRCKSSAKVGAICFLRRR